MGTAWTVSGLVVNDDHGERGIDNSTAGPSRGRTKASKPFVSAHHRPESYDGVFRVVVITSGSVASVKLPLIVGALCKNRGIDVQVVATQASRHFYTQAQVDEEVRAALKQDTRGADAGTTGVRIWVDDDEWSVGTACEGLGRLLLIKQDWKQLGDPILHIELRRWADLVVVAPCSADFLAKLASGLSENLALSLLRALPSTTPVILCPAMNTHMYTHPFTAEHLVKLQDTLGYLISGPQGAGKLACGDEGPGKMTDWRDIVEMIESFATVFHLRHTADAGEPREPPRIPKALNPPIGRNVPVVVQEAQRDQLDTSRQGYTGDLSANVAEIDLVESFVAPGDSDRAWNRLWRAAKD